MFILYICRHGHYGVLTFDHVCIERPCVSDLPTNTIRAPPRRHSACIVNLNLNISAHRNPGRLLHARLYNPCIVSVVTVSGPSLIIMSDDENSATALVGQRRQRQEEDALKLGPRKRPSVHHLHLCQCYIGHGVVNIYDN
jgi:hypothetical protein